MDVTAIVESAKQDLQEIIKEIDIHNLDKREEEVSHYFDFLKSLKKVRHHQKEEVEIPAVISEEPKEVEIPAVISEETKEADCEPIQAEVVEEAERPMYRFERKLRGGFVPDINGYVPEGIVKLLDLEHGDYVYAEEIGSDGSFHKRYEYTLAKEGERKSLEDRIQVNYAIVTEMAGRLVVESYQVGSMIKNIKLDEMPYTIILNEEDIHQFSNSMKVEKGSIIDLAFYKNSPEKNRILWVHNTEGEQMSTDEERAKSYKLTTNNDKREKENNVEQTLFGEYVLIIGDEPKKRHYKEAIEDRGGVFLWADPKDNAKSLEAKVRKSDQVIFLLKVSGHVGMEQIKAMCKQYGVPFQTTWSKGKSTAVSIAEECIS